MKTTVPMKQFVAQRDELDGKYDGIAIMEGNYISTVAAVKQLERDAVNITK